MNLYIYIYIYVYIYIYMYIYSIYIVYIQGHQVVPWCFFSRSSGLAQITLQSVFILFATPILFWCIYCIMFSEELWSGSNYFATPFYFICKSNFFFDAFIALCFLDLQFRWIWGNRSVWTCSVKLTSHDTVVRVGRNTKQRCFKKVNFNYMSPGDWSRMPPDTPCTD